jgi:hypothetical protein
MTDAQTALPVLLHIMGPTQCPRIDKPHTAYIAGAQAPPEISSGGAGGVRLSPCHQPVQPAVSPGYSNFLQNWSFVVEPVTARIQLAKQLILTNLNKCNKVNNLDNFNNLHNDNNCSNLNNLKILTIMTIITILSIITILRIVICFQRRHESTAKRFGPCAGFCRGREKKLNPCVPT